MNNKEAAEALDQLFKCKDDQERKKQIVPLKGFLDKSLEKIKADTRKFKRDQKKRQLAAEQAFNRQMGELLMEVPDETAETLDLYFECKNDKERKRQLACLERICYEDLL